MRNVHLIDFVSGVSTALDYVFTHVTGHHRRVALAEFRRFISVDA